MWSIINTEDVLEMFHTCVCRFENEIHNVLKSVEGNSHVNFGFIVK